MTDKKIDLKAEQQKSLNRPRLKYSIAAKIFFALMDMVTGKKITLAKTKLIEILASIPYRAWENHQYAQLTNHYKSHDEVKKNKKIMQWGRDAQDNEYYHLLVINAKMKEDNLKDAWYLHQPIPFLLVLSYLIFAKLLAFVSIKRAFIFNAEFEDHAEHVYAQFVAENPQWENQPVKSEVVKEYGDFENWADVFRRIGLDEREHRNFSFIFAGKEDMVAE